MNKSVRSIRNILIVVMLGVTVIMKVSAQQDGPMVGNQVDVAKNIDTSVEGEPLNFLVNTPYKELGPMPTKDNKRLYFSRQGHPENVGGLRDEDIWYSEFDEVTQTWTQAINVGPPLNNKGPNFISGIGSRSDTLLLGNIYGKNGKMKSGVSISIRVGDLWSFPQPVNVALDYNLSERASYDLTHDRNALIIAQEKADSKGKLDLYVSLRDPNAKYPYSGTESVNMGPMINTFGNETSPWLSYDGRTLFFSSDGHNGYGKLDIFMSKRLDNTWTNWSKPVNLGPGINSPYDDLSFNFNPDSRYAYYSRGLTPENSDIYRVEMTRLFKNVQVAINELKDTENPAEIGQTQVVFGVFSNNLPEINKEAIADLQYIIGYLKKYKNMIVLVSTHSNEHATRNESLSLSNLRGSNVVDYLVKNGIEKRRLSYRGLGQDIVMTTKSEKVKPSDIAGSVEFKLINLD